MKKEELLLEIRSNWEDAKAYWEPIYHAGDIDVRYATKGPWDEADYLARGCAADGSGGRPTLALDELTQYRNQLKNQVRQNKRAIKVKPEGDGASDETALQRAGIIRGIEYKSKAQQAYSTAFDNCVDRSFGFVKLTTDFDPGTFNRRIEIKPVPNPRVIYLSPEFKEPDASDCGWSFEIDRVSEKEFRKRWPKAEFRSFTPELIAEAPTWFISSDRGKFVQIASYCRVEQGKKKLALLQDGSTADLSQYPGAKITKAKTMEGEEVDLLTLPDGKQAIVVKVRDDNDPKVVQYVTNGIEILETNPLDFTEVPIIPCFGPETWVTENGGSSKREFGSLIRPARGAYKSYCYACSGAIERLGQDPKTPYEGLEGQFNTNTPFQELAVNPLGYVEFSAVELPNGQTYTTLPKRNYSEPQIQQYMLAAEAFRRAIQAAMGGSPLPTAAQRQNQKSGVALERIEESTAQGQFHFIDNYDRMLQRIGRMMDAAMNVVYSPTGFAGREVPFNGEDGEHKVVRINKFTPEGQPDPESFHMGESGSHGVTIDTGPSSQSQRDAADKFSADLLQRPEILGPTPNKVVAEVVKLQNLGPVGTRIADLIAPPDDKGADPQVAAAQQIIQQMAQEIEALKRGDAIKLEEIKLRKYVCDEQEKTKRTLGLVQIDVAEAETLLERELGVIQSTADRAHGASESERQRQHATESEAGRMTHEASEAERARTASADTQLRDQSHQASQAEAERAAAAKAARSKVQ